MLNAEEKSMNRSLAKDLGNSKCLCTVSKMNILASSTPLHMRYANWRGSIKEFVSRCFTIFSIAFITREVRATGLNSLSSLVVLLIGMGMTVESHLGNCTAIEGSLDLEHFP